MIQAYVDESGGKGQGPVFVFSALIAEAEQWADFSDRWSAALEMSPKIAYFKMSEAFVCGGQFYKFSDEERNAKLLSLCRILNDSRLTEFSFLSDLAVFQQGWGSLEVKPFADPYFFPFHATIGAVGYEALARNTTERCEIFFDQNVIFGPRAKAWYPVIWQIAEDILRPVLPIEPLFRDDKEVLPLQGADLTAWIHRRNYAEGLGEFSWLLPELSQLTRSPLSKRLTLEMMTRIAPRPHTREFDAQTKAVLDRYRETFGHDWPPKRKQKRGKKRKH